MSDNLHSNWHTTDGGTEVPVTEVSVRNETVDSITPHASVSVLQPQHVSMRLAAFTGMGLVIASMVTFYFGVDYLRASVLNGEQTHTVTITQGGNFDPSTVTLAPGDGIILFNDNENPQVIKNKEHPDAFTSAALFPAESTMVQIPENVPLGTYTFFSETLSPEVTLTVTLALRSSEQTPEGNADELADLLDENMANAIVENQEQTQQQSSVPEEQPSQINAQPENQPAMASFSSSSSSVAVLTPPPANNQPAEFSLDLDNPQQGNPFAQTKDVPTNPYTVGNTATSVPVQQHQNLHPGAPLTTARPPAQPSTGIGTWLAAVLLFAAFGFLFIRFKKA